VPDGVDLHSVPVLVDAVDDPVGPAPRGVATVEGFIKWLADAVGGCSDRPVDRLHGGGSDVEWQVLVRVAPRSGLAPAIRGDRLEFVDKGEGRVFGAVAAGPERFLRHDFDGIAHWATPLNRSARNAESSPRWK
jgi:hypothetical protein